MHHIDWKENYESVIEFRRSLKYNFNFPIKQEFHCRQFLMDKNPYHGKYTPEERRRIYGLHINFISSLKLKMILKKIHQMPIL